MTGSHFIAATLALALTALAYAGELPDRSQRMRMDCRFHDDHHECLASATYRDDGHGAIEDIHYGVSCDDQTIYDDRGTYMPQQTVSDGIRPVTSAVPRVELMPEGSLRHPGTYSASLTTEFATLGGSCYVTRSFHFDQE